MVLKLPASASAWGTQEFRTRFKQEIGQLDPGLLPLQQGLTISSHVTDRPVQAIILAVSEEAGRIRVKTGIFYTGIVAGCSCADDPTPIDEQNEYCVLQFELDPATGEATVALLED